MCSSSCCGLKQQHLTWSNSCCGFKLMLQQLGRAALASVEGCGACYAARREHCQTRIGLDWDWIQVTLRDSIDPLGSRVDSDKAAPGAACARHIRGSGAVTVLRRRSAMHVQREGEDQLEASMPAKDCIQVVGSDGLVANGKCLMHLIAGIVAVSGVDRGAFAQD